MGGLFTSLNTATTALDALTQALGVAQDNIANASTPGYVSQNVSINAIDPSGSGSSSGDLVTVSSTGNAFTDAVVRSATSQASQDQTEASQLSPINQLFDITGTSGILAALQQFSTAFSNLAVTPGDSTLQASALSAAGNVASAFQSVVANLNSQSTQIASAVQSTTTQINALAANIAQLNAQTAASTEPNPATDANLRSDLNQLSSLVDVTVTTAANGTVSVLAGGQLPLVIGDQAYTLSANTAAAPGSQISSSAGGDSPASFSGQLGGLLNTQNNTIDQLLGSGDNPGTLNTLAAGFASQVNSLVSAGVTSSGAAGAPIFTWDTADPTNAAATLALAPGVTADQLAVGSTGTNAESNGVANALAALPGSTEPADEIDGVSAETYFANIAASVGQQLSDANTASTADQTTLTTAQATQQQQSGVSLDQEAADITAYQRTYDANSQVVSILNQLTEDVVNMVVPSTG